MATSTLTAPQTAATLFTFEKVQTEDFTDFYAIFDVMKNEWVEGFWVTVPEGATYDAVESAFSQGRLVS